jgi:BMFP domain-containing protein YqiC
MAAKARSEQEDLQRQLAGLESRLAALATPATGSSPTADETTADIS